MKCSMAIFASTIMEPLEHLVLACVVRMTFVKEKLVASVSITRIMLVLFMAANAFFLNR